jgi:hypothetical protein
MPTQQPVIKATADARRVPSGPVQFGSDWPGLYLRGDHAIKVATSVRELQKELAATATADGWALKFLAELATLIEDNVAVQPPPST